jgi:hypothetical protein
MNREDIIKLAREAGLHFWMPSIGIEYLERFAALVSAQEREACAKVCESFIPKHERFDDQRAAGNKSRAIAAAIRTRGQEMERKPANAHDKVYSEVELADAYQKGWNDAMLRSSLGMARRNT